jgi:hypothetical protein
MASQLAWHAIVGCEIPLDGIVFVKILFHRETCEVIRTTSPNDRMMDRVHPEPYFRYGLSAVGCIEFAVLAKVGSLTVRRGDGA